MAIVLTHSDVAGLIDRAAVRTAVEQAHIDLSTGAAANPAPLMLPIERGTVLPMAASARRYRSSAVKMLSDMPDNRASGRPAQRSTILLMSGDTGECEAVIDGRLITAIRTAAASAVATAHLARTGSAVLGLIGAGALAIEHARAIARIRPVDTVVVWSRSAETVDRFRTAIADLGLDVQAADSPRHVVTTADIVCTLTPSREPIVEGAWFRPGLHLNVVGAPPRADHREVDGAGMAAARLVVDSRSTALAKSGDVVLAVEEGHLVTDDVATELGDVIVHPSRGRRCDEDITLFDSVGIGLQDLVTARLLVDAALTQGVGTRVELAG